MIWGWSLGEDGNVAFEAQVRKSLARGTPVGAVGVHINKRPIMESKGGRVLKLHALMYILEGHGYFQDVGTPRQPVVPGTVFYQYPGRWHQFDPNPDTAWTEYWVLFDGKEAKRRFGELLPDASQPLHSIGGHESIVEAYEDLHDLWLYGGRAYARQANYLLHRILFEVYRHVARVGIQRQDELVHRARELVRNGLSTEDLDFHDFAEEQGISYEHFRKKFKAATGYAPKQYFLTVKVNRARERLLSPGASVKEIAASLGFSDALYFSRLFKSKVGLSPKQYREANLAQGIGRS
jgi:AraC-like DNA-binding protein